MDKQLVSEFQFEDYKVDYINYDLNYSFEYTEELEIDFELATEIGINKKNNEGKITLIANIFEEHKEKNYPFSLEISLTGFFKAEDEIKKEDFVNFLEMSGTATLFPFLRSAIADITKIANIDSLVLPLINIYNLRQKKD